MSYTSCKIGTQQENVLAILLKDAEISGPRNADTDCETSDDELPLANHHVDGTRKVSKFSDPVMNSPMNSDPQLMVRIRKR